MKPVKRPCDDPAKSQRQNGIEDHEIGPPAHRERDRCGKADKPESAKSPVPPCRPEKGQQSAGSQTVHGADRKKKERAAVQCEKNDGSSHQGSSNDERRRNRDESPSRDQQNDERPNEIKLLLDGQDPQESRKRVEVGQPQEPV